VADSKVGAALRHLPSGYPQVNMAWMWGALLAATMAARLHQLTAITAGQDILAGHGVRGGKAMIATLRWRLIAVPGRLVRHAGLRVGGGWMEASSRPPFRERKSVPVVLATRRR
jgi:hypothetical protein